MVRTEVYCTDEASEEVMVELVALYRRLTKEHPEWEFDVDPTWAPSEPKE